MNLIQTLMNPCRRLARLKLDTSKEEDLSLQSGLIIAKSMGKSQTDLIPICTTSLAI